jgi:hypothetical protein
MDNGLARTRKLVACRLSYFVHFTITSVIIIYRMLLLIAPMGWSSWNAWGGHQSVEIMKETGDLLVTLGLADLGYKHVDLDGGWYNFNGHLNASGYPQTGWDMKG